MHLTSHQLQGVLATGLLLFAVTIPPATAIGADDAASADSIAPLASTAGLLPEDSDVSDYIPNGKVRAVFYHLTTPPELDPLVQKFKEATIRNAEWMKRYRSQHSGELPWHENMGLTEAEYRKFLKLAQEMVYRPHSEGWIDFQRFGNIVTLKTVAAWKDIEGTIVDLDTDRLILLGKVPLTYDGTLQVSKDNKATGAWHGQRWKRTLNGDPSVEVEFVMGQDDESHDGILYYNRRILQSPAPRNVTFLIRYRLDAPE